MIHVLPTETTLSWATSTDKFVLRKQKSEIIVDLGVLREQENKRFLYASNGSTVYSSMVIDTILNSMLEETQKGRKVRKQASK